MMKIFFAFSLMFFVLLPACARAQSLTEPLTIVSKDGTRHVFNVEIARTPEEHEHGLMYRMSLPDDGGMLFVFDQEGERSFWMKNTYLPLDLLFIKKNGVIGHIHENAIPHNLLPIPSQGPGYGVLEILGGMATRMGIKEGDIVHHKAFGNALAK